MTEEEAKNFLAGFLEGDKREFLKEFGFGDCIIDFVVKFRDNMWCGVEVKGEKTNEVLAMGQLLHYYQHSSHVILCAPKQTVDKVLVRLKPNPECQSVISKLGIYTINADGSIDTTKEPANESYYFNIPTKTVQKKIYGPPKHGILDPIDEFILKIVRERGSILMAELYEIIKKENKANFSLEALRKRLKNLVFFKYLKYVMKYATVVALRD